MDGPSHYLEAERLLDKAAALEAEPCALTLREAQVHATLALAAATVEAGEKDDEWAEATE